MGFFGPSRCPCCIPCRHNAERVCLTVVTDTGGTANRLYVSPETPAMTVAGTPADGDTVFFRVYRKAADAADTLAIVSRLHGVDLFITTNAENDA